MVRAVDRAWGGGEEARERGPSAAAAFYLHERTPAGLRITPPTPPQSVAAAPSPTPPHSTAAASLTPPESSTAHTQSAAAAAPSDHRRRTSRTRENVSHERKRELHGGWIGFLRSPILSTQLATAIATVGN
uniref:Uncharacterized protein n=1 Tax=Oryza meridionalis TaxID=40149 RepID=A0A0E0EGS4_9ORYZ